MKAKEKIKTEVSIVRKMIQDNFEKMFCYDLKEEL